MVMQWAFFIPNFCFQYTARGGFYDIRNPHNFAPNKNKILEFTNINH